MKTVVKSLIYDDGNNVLILVRSNTHPKYAGEDDLPGGELENDESAIQSITRETFEETGLTLDAAKVEEVCVKLVDPDTRHVLFIGKVTGIKPKVTLSWEHSSYNWFSRDQNYKLRSHDDYISTVNKWLVLNGSAS